MMKTNAFASKIIMVIVTFSLFGEVTARTLPGRYRTTEWNVVEITLHNDSVYEDPFNNVSIDALFEGPKGLKIVRPAFWDGGNTWRVRFAPPRRGTWRMTTVSNKADDNGIHSVKCRVNCKRYKGNLDIYKHGFVRGSDNGRYFAYNDGTPFFYLGDTHWCYIHERYDTSNVEGIESQFRYIVDKRVEQGFTVYQSEAIQYFDHSTQFRRDEIIGEDEEPHCSFDNGFGEDDLPGLRNIDRKFAYIAQKGLLHANSQICWATEPTSNKSVYTNKYMYKLGRYWSARFGAFPVLWTVAQEVDKNLYGRLTTKDLDLWKNMAKGLTENDAYHHPLTAHMEEVVDTDAGTSSWKNESFHSWWAIQWKGKMNNPSYIKTFWHNDDVKPCILYESGYEHLAVDAKTALRQGFIAFQSGLFGYGYGANGIWNDLYAENDMACFYHMPQQYLNWYEGANLEGADLLANLKAFYQSISWWELEPHYDDKNWGEFSKSNNYALSSINNRLYLVYIWGETTQKNGKIKKLKADVKYIAKWYKPLEGTYYDIGEYISKNGEFTIPERPTQDDWMFILEEKK